MLADSFDLNIPFWFWSRTNNCYFLFVVKNVNAFNFFLSVQSNPIQWSSEVCLEAIQLLLCCTGFLVKHIKCSSGEGEVSTSTAQMEFLIHLRETGGIRRGEKFAYTLLG